MAVAVATKRWTLEELHSLPDDGNRYELVGGQLFVTPAPRQLHQVIVHNIAGVLAPYVAAHGLGRVWQARSVIRWGQDEVEPDVFVRARIADPDADWSTAPRPILVVEVLSDTTRRRDVHEKRRFYLEVVGVPEYWIVDPDSRTIRVARPACADLVADAELSWRPDGAAHALSIPVSALFEP